MVVSTVTSLQEDPGFDTQIDQGCICVRFAHSACAGFLPQSKVSPLSMNYYYLLQTTQPPYIYYTV